jgi:eukaryotic-like serine/threonine-protein kinase
MSAESPRLTTSLQAGDVVAGKYVLEREVGRGGLGVVMSAQHAVLRKRVALKFLRPEFVREPEAVGRFLREAQAAALMRGEHVARVMDAGTLETGEAFLVMEHLEGRDLAAVLDQDGPLPVEDAVDYLLQACEAVAEAHAFGIVHRDLKPANLFLTHAPDGSPCVKVLDFGLSKLVAAEPPGALTAHHQVLGSPHFMSPEQMRSSRDVDARSDVWALGAVLFTLIAGRCPFEGRVFAEICAAVLGGDRKRLRDERPDAPAELEAIVARCLSADPEARYESVASLAVALAPFAPQRAHPRVERVGRVLEASRASAPQSVDPPAAWPSTAVPEPARSSTSPPSLKSDLSTRDSAPGVSTTSGGVSSVPGLVGQTDRPPWSQPSATEIVTPAPAQPSASLSLGIKLGALGAFGVGLIAWGALRAGGVGEPPASSAPQRVVIPLAVPTELSVSASVSPPHSTGSPADGQTPTPEASSASHSPPLNLNGPLKGATPTPSATPAAPPRHTPSKRPPGRLSDEELIKSLPH